MAACFSVDMFDNGAFNKKSNKSLPGSAKSSYGADNGAFDGGGGDARLPTNSPPHVVPDEGLGGCLESTEPPVPGKMSRKFAAEVLPECQMLTSAMQR